MVTFVESFGSENEIELMVATAIRQYDAAKAILTRSEVKFCIINHSRHRASGGWVTKHRRTGSKVVWAVSTFG